MKPHSILLSAAMLKSVIAGETYDAVAAEHGVSRTAVERRIKVFARKLNREVGIDGLNEGELGFVQRMRRCSAAVMAALERYTPTIGCEKPAGRILTDQEIELALQRTRAHSTCLHRDVALFYMVLSTGARPLEIARLEVRDYLNVDGSVRIQSVMRADVSISRKARPLFFASSKVNEAIDRYLAERLRQNSDPGKHSDYRGFDPHCRLFLTETGVPFEVVCYGEQGQMRFLCRGILNTYRKIFRHIGMKGLSALNLRATVAARLLQRGAIEDQIGELLGISTARVVRELLQSLRQPLQSVVRELV